MDQNIVWHQGLITEESRFQLLNQRGVVLWLTGLSGSGKSTIAVELEKQLFSRKKIVYRLDGDNIRHGLNQDLGFSTEDREENIRRIAEVARLFYQAGIITLVSFITPLQSMRDRVKKIIGESNLVEIFVKCSLETCKKRDPKGLYQKAENGQIKNFTGISALYENPVQPNLTIDTEENTINQAAQIILDHIRPLINF